MLVFQRITTNAQFTLLCPCVNKAVNAAMSYANASPGGPGGPGKPGVPGVPSEPRSPVNPEIVIIYYNNVFKKYKTQTIYQPLGPGEPIVPGSPGFPSCPWVPVNNSKLFLTKI